MTATTATLALLGGPGLSSAQASSAGASSRVATLEGLVTVAKAKESSLLAQVQRVREQLDQERSEIGAARLQLASLISAEYTGAPEGMLEVLVSPSINAALDTQLALSRLAAAEKQSLQTLATNVRAEQVNQRRLVQAERDAKVTAARLQAEEIAAAFLAANPPPVTVAAPQSAPPSPSPHPQRPAASAPPTPTPPPAAPPPTPAPTPAPTAAPAPPPSDPTPAAGPFSVTTNLTQSSGINLTQIQEFLQGTPLEADSSYFLQAEAADHVSAIYLISDAVLETGFGTSQLYQVKHNLFGFEAYDVNPYGDGATFPSDQACISFVAWYVSVYYLTPPGASVANQGSQGGTVPTGQFYNGPTPAGMNVDYASDPDWATKIATIGDQLQSMPG